MFKIQKQIYDSGRPMPKLVLNANDLAKSTFIVWKINWISEKFPILRNLTVFAEWQREWQRPESATHSMEIETDIFLFPTNFSAQKNMRNFNRFRFTE